MLPNVGETHRCVCLKGDNDIYSWRKVVLFLSCGFNCVLYDFKKFLVFVSWTKNKFLCYCIGSE